MELKKILAKEISAKVKEGECIGLGTGSTAEEVIKEIASRVKKEGLEISGVSTSIATTSIASDLGIKVIPINKIKKIDWGFDGADEVSPEKALIKGRGGALLREKIVSNCLTEWIIAVTEDKLVKKLGQNCLLPIEVIPNAITNVETELASLGAKQVQLRTGTNFYGPLFTETGNFILDAKFDDIDDSLANKIKLITGVVEHGYFSAHKRTRVLVVKKSGDLRWC